ncbi:MAG TPA: outer membrane beta-barrel protein [Novosphingobium sp.]|nr:outer membrane beta-barrel protein [Novosphingobium sp.]
MRRAIVVALPLTLFALPSAGFAQNEPPPSPADRYRSEYEPVGGRIGSIMLHPTAEARIEYNDNTLALPQGGPDDIILTARAEIDAKTLWKRHQLEANAYAQQSVYSKSTTEDALEGGAKISGIYDISRTATFRGSLASDFLAENRVSITNFGQARKPTRYSQISAGGNFSYHAGHFSVNTDLQAQRLDFQDATGADGLPIDQDYRDSMYLRGSVTAAYDVSPRLAVLVRSQIDRLAYTHDETAPDALDRDSTGYAVEGGVRLDLSNLITGEVRAGYLRRKADDARIPDASGLSFGANLRWDITPLTTIRFFADRQIEEGGSALNAGNLRSQGRLTIEHELLRNLVLEADARAAQVKAVGEIHAKADEIDLRFGATYLVNRRWRIFGSVRHFDRSSNDNFYRTFKQNQVTMGLRAAF